MKQNAMQEQVVEVLRRSRTRPLAAAEIGEQLQLRGGAKKRLQRTLGQLVLSGEIVRIRNNRYSLGEPADLVTGTLTVVRSGNGFVAASDGGADVFVFARDLSTALPHDRVTVRLHPPAETETDTRRAGKVVDILERAGGDIVGTLKTTGRFLYVVPIDPGYKKDFYVPDSAGAQIDDRVVVRFVNWEHKHVNPEAEIVEVLGASTAPSVDTIAIVKQFHLPGKFTPEVLQQADAAVGRAKRPGKRLDLRDRFILTIDPESARDFDDALSLEKGKAGERVLGIHIADVSHFIRPGSALDKEAATRGNSVYLPDQVIPMLPEALSNGICSLRPHEDRLSFSVFLTVDPRGNVTARRFARTLIRSKVRLTYRQALSALVGEKPDKALDRQTMALLHDIGRLAQQFRRKRAARHALSLDVPECRIELDAAGSMTGYRIEENDPSHQLIEECMVAANEAVAMELAERGVPSISRLHEPPREEKIADLAAELVKLGFSPGDLRHPRNLAKFLGSVKGHALEHHVHIAVLRSMNRAMYSADAMGHFGLAKKFYLHFTSPIRRYPDLLVHRQLGAVLTRDTGGGQRRIPYSKPRLAAAAQHCSDTERNAEEAERSLKEMKKYRFLENVMKEDTPRIFEAVVVNVTNFGMFVEILDLQIQGLVHISAISDRFVQYSGRQGHLRAGRRTYGIGRRLRVVVSKVDFEKRMVDFLLPK